MYECANNWVKDMKLSTAYTDDLLIEVNPYVEPAKLFGWADIRRMVHQCGTDSSNNTLHVLNSEFFLLLVQLP